MREELLIGGNFADAMYGEDASATKGEPLIEQLCMRVQREERLMPEAHALPTEMSRRTS